MPGTQYVFSKLAITIVVIIVWENIFLEARSCSCPKSLAVLSSS